MERRRRRGSPARVGGGQRHTAVGQHGHNLRDVRKEAFAADAQLIKAADGRVGNRGRENLGKVGNHAVEEARRVDDEVLEGEGVCVREVGEAV
ncbi:hypothetical protein FACS189472_14120 [Alphaproteobacteria bacterium]|nr:hypothetical protein FACS189472_14120 [Alphaproteobacteria bacterium]